MKRKGIIVRNGKIKRCGETTYRGWCTRWAKVDIVGLFFCLQHLRRATLQAETRARQLRVALIDLQNE